MLDEELRRLPEHYRAALVLCYLEGRSSRRGGASARLVDTNAPRTAGAWPRALHARLVRRGLTLSAALAGPFAYDCTARAVPADPLVQIVRSVSGPAVGGTAAVSPQVAALVQGALFAMIRLKLKYCLVSALVVLLGIGGSAAYHFCTAQDSPQAWSAALTPEEVRAEETVELKGQVLDPDGHPVAGAELYVVAPGDSPLNNGLALRYQRPGRSIHPGRPRSPSWKAPCRRTAGRRNGRRQELRHGRGSSPSSCPRKNWNKVNPFDRLSMMFSESAAVLKLARDQTPRDELRPPRASPSAEPPSGWSRSLPTTPMISALGQRPSVATRTFWRRTQVSAARAAE